MQWQSSLYEVEGDVLRVFGEAADAFDRCVLMNVPAQSLSHWPVSNWPPTITTLHVQFYEFSKLSPLFGATIKVTVLTA